MSRYIVPLLYLVAAPLVLRPAWEERRRFWLLLLLLLIGLALCEGVALGRLYGGFWWGLEILFAPIGTWMLGPQGG